MASVSAADVRDALNLTPADIPDSKVAKMIKRAEVTLVLETGVLFITTIGLAVLLRRRF